MAETEQAILTLFAWGNPSRGDDAIGPKLYHIIEQFIAQHALNHIALIEDFQLQPEHVFDICEHACVVFIDASYQGSAPYQVMAVKPTEQLGYSSHALSPAALMTLYNQTQNKPCPPAFQLSVRGYCFELGLPTSEQATKNIQRASVFLKQLLLSTDPQQLLLQAADNNKEQPYA